MISSLPLTENFCRRTDLVKVELVVLKTWLTHECNQTDRQRPIVDANFKQRFYCRTAVLGADPYSCLPPCTVSRLWPSIYAKKSASFFDANNFNTTLVLRMPTIIQLTSSTFSYSFMNFASEFGGTILNLIQRKLFI